MSWSKAESILTHGIGLTMLLLILYRPLSSIALILLGLAVLFSQFIKDKPKINWTKGTLGLVLLLTLFIAYFLSYHQHFEHPDAWPRFEKKLPILFIPLIWLISGLRWNKIKNKVYLWLLAGILIAGSIMLIGSIMAFVQTLDWHQFFYHAFTTPIKISAIYFSWFIVVAMAWPVAVKDLPISAATHLKLEILLMTLLLLCASKLFVVLGVGISIYKWIKYRKGQTILWKQVALFLLAVALSLPVMIRTTSILDTNISIVMQDQYEYNTKLNGLTLRLIQIRLGFEVLSNENAWFTGVGQTSSKSKLDERYIAHNMYTGNPELGDRGLLAYNYHNQWMETLVAIGLPGLTVLTSIFIWLAIIAYQKPFLSSFVIVCFSFMLTESFMEREQGIVLFTFLACFIYKPNSIE